jgi:ferritin-like metal-binding protein YciE
MAASTLEELFEHELEDIYHAEHELHEALGELASQVETEEIQSAFEEHRQETEEQIDRLEQVFETVGEPPEKEECEGIEGLLEEQEEFAEEDPETAVLELFNLASAQKTEHYEIAAYGNTTLLASQLGYEDAADLLEQNLREEEEALDELSQLAENYDFESVPRE